MFDGYRVERAVAGADLLSEHEAGQHGPVLFSLTRGPCSLVLGGGLVLSLQAVRLETDGKALSG